MALKPLNILALIGAAALVGSAAFVALRFDLLSPTQTAPAENVAPAPPAQPFTGAYASIAQDAWQLVRFIDGKGPGVPPQGYRVSFQAQALSGTWCNQFGAPYTVSDDDPPKLRFSLLQRSRQLCAGVEMRPEDALVASMKEGFTVTLESGGLILTGLETGYRFEFQR